MPSPGVFIVLEGSDGSGKTTQFNLLNERLKAAGYDVEQVVFPRYEKESSHFVREYLDGNYGPAAEISPYTASMFYALDRYEASKGIEKFLNEGKIVLASRYVGSNMAHQGGKFTNPVEQRGFFIWADNLEYEMLKIPRPDVNFFLRVPAEVSHRLILERAKKEGTTGRNVEHENDLNHLKNAVATYDLMCKLFPKDFKAIDCVKYDKLLSVPEISNLIWERLKPLLPADKPKAGHSAVVTLGANNDSGPKVSAAGGPDRLTVPFKSASLLLRQSIEAVYPGSTVPKNGDWADNSYEFYTPTLLPKELKQEYKAILSGLAEKHKKLLEKLKQYYQRQPATKDQDLSGIGLLLKPLTPLSAVVPFEAVINKREVLSLARHLLEADSAESQWAAKQLYLVAREVWPADFKQPLETSEITASIGSIIAKLSPERLSPQDSNQAVTLLEAAPRQEFDLLAESVYPYSNLSLSEITEEVADWPYQQKYDSLRRSAGQANILNKVRYKMEIISDQLTLNSFAHAAHLQHVQVQAITPRYGFDVPLVFESANLDDLYNAFFDDSLRLYSLLQSAGQDDLTGYAALMGHKVRWQLNATAANFLNVLMHKDEATDKLLSQVLEVTAEIHPILWDVLSGNTITASQKLGHNRVKPYHQHHKKRSKPKKQ